MIEAVNSTLQNAAITRPVASQSSTTESLTANPQKVQKTTSAPFVSPFIFVDSANEQVVLQIRNGETGDAISQYPSQQLDVTVPKPEAQVSQPSFVAVEAQAAVQAQQSAPDLQSAQQRQEPIQGSQAAAFASASASGTQLETAGVSVFA